MGVFIASGRAAQFLAQADNLQLDKPLFGLNTFESSDALAAVKKFMPGLVFPSAASTPEFAQNYSKRFGSDIQIPFGALGHDFALLAAIVREHAPQKDSPAGWIAALRQVAGFQGVCGPVRFSQASPSGPAFDMPTALRRVSKNGVETILIQE